MITHTYKAARDGRLVASGSGFATITAELRSGWAIGASDTDAPALEICHAVEPGKDVCMALEEGEHLWVFGETAVAVTASFPAQA